MPNRLAAEQSPYLLQHAHNPVDWYPWGDEAFAAARASGKAIFLSIGYATCHWCHVMERESFEDAALAAVLNEHFIAIKVDREERPDVDRVYMTFVQATTGSGGWPMSVFLTPDLQPFYGGTYFPPTSQWGRPGFRDVLVEIARAWREERDKVLHSAGEIVARLAVLGKGQNDRRAPDASALDGTFRQFRQTFDTRRGGFGDAPKFPRPSELLFLLRESERTGDPAGREMVRADAARHGARRDARSHRRRLPPLFRGRRLARAALREDAVRPGAAGARVSRGRPGGRRSVLRADCGGHPAVRAAGDDRRGGRLLFSRGRRQRAARSRRATRRRTRAKARSTSGAWTRCARHSAPTARCSRAGTACCPAATRRSIRRASSPTRTCCTPPSRSRTCRA